MVIAVVPAVGARVTVTVAATPDDIVLALVGPASRHVTKPVAEAQYIALPAAVAAGLARTDTAEIWLEGIRPESTPDLRAMLLKLKRIGPEQPCSPGLLVADDKLRLETCADAGWHR